MHSQPQIQQSLTGSDSKKRLKKRLVIVIILILALFASTITIFSLLGVIPGVWAAIVSALLTIFSFVFGIWPLIFTNDKAAVTAPSIHIEKLEVHAPSQSTGSAQTASSSTPHKPPAAFRGILGIPPPSDPRTIQQREQIVRDIYQKLIQPDVSAVVLTGIGGIGKSTLAALVYRYAEAQQSAGSGPFTASPLWLRVDPAVTLADILSNLCVALDVLSPDVSTLTPSGQAAALFNMLNTAGKGHLVVLDQFENVLDNEGRALPDRPGIGEWLDALNSQPCTSRILLTSRPDPQGRHTFPQTYLRVYHVQGLNEAEGIDLLRKWGVQGSEAEIYAAIQRCRGHALSLTLMAALLQKRNLSLATLLKSPQYTQLWMGDIAQELLDAIYKELDPLERKMLSGFSVYREPVSLDAANAVIEQNSREATLRVQDAIDTLLAKRLLEVGTEGRYYSHTIVAEYARDHLMDGGEQANRQALLAMHASAGRYYLEQAKTSCPPRDKRRSVSDVQDLLEAVWQFCQAERWQGAHEIIQKESIFEDVKRWGGNAQLLELYQLLLPPDKWSSDTSQTAGIYNDLGWVYSDLGKKKKAQECYEQALSGFRKAENRWGEGYALFNLGSINNTLGKQDEALRYFEQALDAHKEVGNRKGEVRALNSIGRIHGDSGQLELALDYFEQALVILKEEGDDAWEARTLFNLGMVYNALGQKDAALEYYQQALDINIESGDRGEEGKVLSNLGLFYRGLGQPEKALEYLKQALDIHREIGNRQWESVILNNLGSVYINLLEEENALKSFGLAWNIEKEVGNSRDEGVTLLNIGALFFKRKQYAAALASFLCAQQIFQEIKRSQDSIAFRISAVREELGDEPFAALVARVEYQAQQIVEQAMRENNE